MTNLKPGTIISVPKAPFVRHVGLCIENGLVAHAQPNSGACITSLTDFSGGHPVRIDRIAQNPHFAVKAAHALVDAGYSYSLFASNCEHFVSLCERGEMRSPQLRLVMLVVGAFLLING